MKTSHLTTEKSIAPSEEQYINGPYWEPPTIPNATTYWQCTSCQRESTRKQDLYRERFHAPDCEVRR